MEGGEEKRCDDTTRIEEAIDSFTKTPVEGKEKQRSLGVVGYLANGGAG